jgi:hypothetical protein
VATPDCSSHSEALRLVQGWSQGLVLVQSAALGVIGALLQEPPRGLSLLVTLLLLASLLFSIGVGTVWVSGTVPSIAQRLPLLLAQDPQLDIYAQKGALTGPGRRALGPTLGDQCLLQANSFLLSLLLFCLLLLLRSG